MSGHSEADFGRVLSRYPRDSYIIQTKLRPAGDLANCEGWSAGQVFRRKVIESMERLQVKHATSFVKFGVLP